MNGVVESLVRKVGSHQAGVLLDTNLLLLYLADKTSDQISDTWKQTEAFTAAHIMLLRELTTAARHLVTTPHILTEASDLADHGVPGRWRDGLRANLRAFMLETRERYVESRRIAGDDAILHLGLADLAQTFFSWRSRPLVLTVDADLTGALEKRKLPVMNLHHHVFALS
jgi:hypothetical protein